MTLEQSRSELISLLSATSEDRYSAGWDQTFIDSLRGSTPIWRALEQVCEGWPKGYRGEDGWDPCVPLKLGQSNE